ncbi:MAG: hypothetical protein GY792_26835 [Gammaproteobacteria bacterium]|nr:hypothetical protein [Gammaproteobacteria bacterium]
MNQAAVTRKTSFEISKANAYLLATETETEKTFTKRAFIVITMILLAAWFLTG